jgi:hypothetical protein
MKSIINQRKVARRAMLANIASVAGLLALLASVLVPLFWPAYLTFAYILMIAGLGVAMMGIYFANGWVKRPRPETSLGAALKSLSDAHRLYHYPSLPCDHVLLTPNGLVVLETVNLGSRFTYKDGRWREGFNFGRALRYIVEEHLGDPVKNAIGAAQFLEERVNQMLEGKASVPVKPVVVFTHPASQLDVENPPIPVCKLDKLKKHVQIQGPRLEQATYEQIASYLDGLI